MEEVTFELILIGECEIQQTKPTGRGKSLWKASKVKKTQRPGTATFWNVWRAGCVS